MSATAASLSLRPLKPILEDTEDTKSMNASSTDNHFFSDDEDDTFQPPKSTAPSSAVDKITFSNSSFSTLIKGTTTVSANSGSIDTNGSRSISPLRTLPFETHNATVLESQGTTPSIINGSDGEGNSPWTANPFDFSQSQLMQEVDTEADDPFGFAAWESGFSAHPSAVSETKSLGDELQAAKEEIALLMEAVHEKDMSVINAYKQAEELKEKYSTGRREGPVTQQRLDTALRNATELESKNVVLTTRVAELEADVRRMSSRFRDLAAVLNLPGTAEEKVVEEQVIRKVELLSAVEKEVSDARNERHNDAFVQQNLHKEISNLRKQLENQERHITQVEDFEARKMAARDQEISSLKDRLTVANETLQEHEKLNIALSAERKKLSAELRTSHDILDRKDSLIQELTSSTDRERTVQETHHGKLPSRNHTGGSAGLNGEVGNVKRELRLLNAALRQVITASDSSSHKLQTEIHNLQSKVEQFKKTELLLREQMRSQEELFNERSSEILDSKVAITNRSTQTLSEMGAGDGLQRNPAVEWAETIPLFQQRLLTEVPNPAHQEKTDMASLVAQQQVQISELLSVIRQTQLNTQPSSTAHTQAAPAPTSSQLSEDFKFRDATLVLQKMLTEREDEIEYWRTQYSISDNKIPYHDNGEELRQNSEELTEQQPSSRNTVQAEVSREEILPSVAPSVNMPVFPTFKVAHADFGGQEGRPASKPELPNIDYESIRARNKQQLEQLQRLSRKYDQAQIRNQQILQSASLDFFGDE